METVRDSASPIVAVVGPTATGKSRLALALAERLGGEIVNADALQVYRGFDIGTAKPGPDERARVPHHLLDILEPEERYSAGEFRRRALVAIGEIRGRGRLPLLVGGSGLYLRALLDGISPIPPVPETVRRRLARAAGAPGGLAALRQGLEAVDPEIARRLPPGDRQRLLRALEVHEATGRPISAWQRERPFGQRALPALRLGLTLPRPLLYDAIARRLRDMVAAGWVAEVRALLDAGIPPQAPAFQALGYRQLVRHILGDQTLDQAMASTLVATRRFAKRQSTWFRKEAGVRWLDATDPDAALAAVAARIERMR